MFSEFDAFGYYSKTSLILWFRNFELEGFPPLWEMVLHGGNVFEAIGDIDSFLAMHLN